MPTRNKRVNVTLPDAQWQLLTRLAKVQRRSRASVLLELFQTIAPVLERVATVAEAAERAQVQATEGFRDSVERAEAAMLPEVAKALGQFDWLLEDAVERDKRHFGPGVVLSPGGMAGVSEPERSERRRRLPTPVRVTTGVRFTGGGGKRTPKRRVSRSARRKS